MLIPDNVYEIIKKSMPIPCIDLIVANSDNEILMLKRANDPAKGEWWFPGGRVHFGESREQAVYRKLKQECGLSADRAMEIGTSDLILINSDDSLSHAITTVFRVEIKDNEVLLDSQSIEYKWDKPNNWIHKISDQFLLSYLKNIANG